MTDITIRKATIEELPTIQKLSNTLGEQSYSFDNDLSLNWANTDEGEKYYRAKIAEEKGVCLVAEKNNEILGFASGTIHDPDAWRLVKRVEVDNVFVSEKFRGQGIGKLLIDGMKQWGKEVGAKRIILNAFTDNVKAVAFYQREGFSPYETILQQKID